MSVVCPNGHAVVDVHAVKCDECEARVAFVPLAVELELREQLHDAVGALRALVERCTPGGLAVAQAVLERLEGLDG